MTDEEIEAVAEELAKVGGVAWYPGRTEGPVLRAVGDRYRDRAKVAIAALDRFRASKETPTGPQVSDAEVYRSTEGQTRGHHGELQVGTIVVYRPLGDKRAISCRIEKLEEGRAYLVPCSRPNVGWVALDSLQPLTDPAPRQET